MPCSRRCCPTRVPEHSLEQQLEATQRSLRSASVCVEDDEEGSVGPFAPTEQASLNRVFPALLARLTVHLSRSAAQRRRAAYFVRYIPTNRGGKGETVRYSS